MLVYGFEVVLHMEIELPATHLVIVAQLEPFHHNYIVDCIIALEHLDEYHSNATKCL